MGTGDLLSFGPYLLDLDARRLTRDGEDVRLGVRAFDLLCLLVTKAGQLLSKEELISVAWSGVAVGTGSFDTAIYDLRRLLPMPGDAPLIETQPRRGVRFLPKVTRVQRRASDDSLDAIMETYRAWTDGRAALETLDAGEIVRARGVFETVVARAPEMGSGHVGLANACALLFEMARTDAAPNIEALQCALRHALEARRLDEKYSEAWATLGFVLERAAPCGFPQARREDALLALRQALFLEPDNWRHRLRFAAGSFGEERLLAARRTLLLMPGLALAHLLVATVLVGRGVLDQAQDELRIALTGVLSETPSPYGYPALNWLLGLILLARGDRTGALMAFQRELALEHSGHLYAREVTANTYYAIGATCFHAGVRDDAQEAFLQCLTRVPTHPLALAALGRAPAASGAPSVDRAIAQAVFLVADEEPAALASAALAIDRALTEAPAGSAGWLLLVEPMLQVTRSPAMWAGAVARLRSRSA